MPALSKKQRVRAALHGEADRPPVALWGHDFLREWTSEDLIANTLGMDLWGGVGLWNRLQIAAMIPMTLYQSGSDFTSPNPMATGGTFVRGVEGFAFGDPRIHLKVLLYGKEYGFKISISHWLSIPLGNDDEFGGEKHFDGFAGEPRVLP